MADPTIVPVFVAGKLMGFRRKKNDRLLMFILRHYGQDAAGRRTTINYFSTKATAGAAANPPLPPAGEGKPRSGEGEGLSPVTPHLTAAEASTTTVKTIITGAPAPSEAPLDDDDAARLLESFAGVDLDDQAKADIYRALEQAAERRRALDADPTEDPELWFVAADEAGDYAGELESGVESEESPLRAPGEHHWESLGEGGNAEEIDRAVAEMAAAKQLPSPRAGEGEPPSGGEGEGKYAPGEAKVVRPEPVLSLSRAQSRGDVDGPVEAIEGPVLSEVGDDPRLDWRNWQTGKYVEPPRLSSPSSLGEGDQPKGGGGAGTDGEETDEAALHPSPPPDDPEPATPTPNRAGVGKRKRPYGQRQPKPAFTGLDETTEARAREEVTAQKREAAEAEKVRRTKRAERKPPA